jgi:O-methyltransferase
MSRRTLVLTNFHRLGLKTGKRLMKYAYAIFLSDFINKSKAPKFADRFRMYDGIVEAEQLAGSKLQYLEFGVFKGESIKFWASKNADKHSLFYGFDSFEGLPENWFPGMGKGVFNVGGEVPETGDGRILFVKGWFNKTLPGFVGRVQPDDSARIVLHLDADLYSSTYYVLNCLYFQHFIRSGTILIFDEAIVASIADTEFRAFYDFVQAMNIKYTVIGIAKFEMAIKIL